MDDFYTKLFQTYYQLLSITTLSVLLQGAFTTSTKNELGDGIEKWTNAVSDEGDKGEDDDMEIIGGSPSRAKTSTTWIVKLNFSSPLPIHSLIFLLW